MNHSTKIGSLLVFLASSALALPGCMADATGAEDQDEAAASVENTDAENANTASEENAAEGSQALNQRFGYWPPGYGGYGPHGNPWYSGYGYIQPGRGYFHPGFGYLPPAYRGIPAGYGFWQPGAGYWRPGYGYWRPGYGFGYGAYGGW